MSFEETIRHIISEVVEEKLREHDVVIADKLAQIMGKVDVGEFLSVNQAAKHACVGPDTIRNWVKEKKLRAHRAGNRLRIKAAELERAMSPRIAVIVDTDIDQQAAAIARKLGA